MWEVNFTTEFEGWWDLLSIDQQEDLAAIVELLTTLGPALGRPYCDTIRSSRHQNL